MANILRIEVKQLPNYDKNSSVKTFGYEIRDNLASDCINLYSPKEEVEEFCTRKNVEKMLRESGRLMGERAEDYYAISINGRFVKGEE